MIYLGNEWHYSLLAEMIEGKPPYVIASVHTNKAVKVSPNPHLQIRLQERKNAFLIHTMKIQTRTIGKLLYLSPCWEGPHITLNKCKNMGMCKLPDT